MEGNLELRHFVAMPLTPLSRRKALSLVTRVAATASLAAFSILTRSIGQTKRRREFDIRDYGAIGDGTTPDTTAMQRAVDEAAAAGPGSRVIVPGGKSYLVGSVQLRGGIEFHLADDAEIVVSSRPEDYGNAAAAFTANEAQGLSITGSGSLNGRSDDFMERYEEADEWWIPKKFRPRLMMLTGCRDLVVSGIAFKQAPSWTLHLLGCDRVQVDRVRIDNRMDVPNCDGIDPDHCRNVEISNCHIKCGDDAIVVKTSRNGTAFGGSSNIFVRDCVLETQDSGVKIGTETTRDIDHVRFERCQILSSCRGCAIQLRDEGNVRDVLFRDIEFKSRYHSAPWWGRGEAISFTAMPRAPGTPVGKISGVRVENVTGRAENSVRISGSPESRISDVVFENVGVTLDRWTNYPGGLWDNRPTTAYLGIEPHGNPGIHVRYADNVALKRCRIDWGKNRPDYFTHALEAHDVTGLTYPDFMGEAAHPGRDAAISVRPM